MEDLQTINKNILQLSQLLSARRLEEALALSAPLANALPHNADVQNAHASILLSMERDAEASMVLERAHASFPQHPDVLNNLALLRKRQNRLEESQTLFEAALRVQPGNAKYLGNLCRLLLQRDMSKAAIPHFRQMLRVNENDVFYWQALATALQSTAHSDEAKAIFAEAARRFPDDMVSCIMDALYIPTFMESEAAIEKTRQALEQGVARLRARAEKEPGFRIGEDVTEVNLWLYYLAYHGVNNKPLLQQVAALFRQLSPSLSYTAPHCAPGVKRREGKLRFGIVSAWMCNHSVGRAFSRMLPVLKEEADFEVVFFSLVTEPRKDEVFRRVVSECSHTVELKEGTKLSELQRQVAEQEIDVLLYTDVAMTPQCYWLSFARLAPLQAIVGGHPDTTGVDTVDYFFSYDPVEPPGSEDSYSETLVRLPYALDVFTPPSPPQKKRSRLSFGLPPEGPLYVCPMVLTKMHPAFDPILKDILTRDTNGTVVFMRDARNDAWAEQFLARLKEVLEPEQFKRVKMLNWLSHDDFLSISSHASVVLDPPHFGSGTTTFYLTALGIPIVTQPGLYARSRTVYYAYHVSGTGRECIVSSPEEYAERAVRIANDAAYREAIRQDILSGKDVLFNNPQGARAFADVLRGMSLAS